MHREGNWVGEDSKDFRSLTGVEVERLSKSLRVETWRLPPCQNGTIL